MKNFLPRKTSCTENFRKLYGSLLVVDFGSWEVIVGWNRVTIAGQVWHKKKLLQARLQFKYARGTKTAKS